MKLPLDLIRIIPIPNFSPTYNMSLENTLDTYSLTLVKQQNALQKALIEAIAETPEVHADSVNPFHKSNYASLNAHLALVKPIFSKHGLAIIQCPTGHNGHIGITTKVIHKDGGSFEFESTIPVSSGIKAQEAGSIYSYLRRYSIAAVAGIATDDDDANTTVASAPAVKPTYKAVTPKKLIATNNVPSAPSGDVDFALQVPFGKAKGTSLQDLAMNDLNYWANTWEPKPWEKTGKVGIKDLTLKSSAQALWVLKNSESEGENDEPSEDAIPF